MATPNRTSNLRRGNRSLRRDADLHSKSHGGRRPGAGRPPRPPEEQRVQIHPSVLKSTEQRLNKLAFDLLVSTGDVIDRLVARYKTKTPKKNEDNNSTGKIGPPNPPAPQPSYAQIAGQAYRQGSRALASRAGRDDGQRTASRPGSQPAPDRSACGPGRPAPEDPAPFGK